MSDNKKYVLTVIDLEDGTTETHTIDGSASVGAVEDDQKTTTTKPGLYISAEDEGVSLADVILYRLTPNGWLSDADGAWVEVLMGELPDYLIPLEMELAK